jgi:hypothetical protein
MLLISSGPWLTARFEEFALFFFLGSESTILRMSFVRDRETPKRFAVSRKESGLFFSFTGIKFPNTTLIFYKNEQKLNKELDAFPVPSVSGIIHYPNICRC